MASCSVVMVAYNTGPALFAAIKAALKQKQLAEFIIVDNGNPPDVLTRLQQMALTEPRIIISSGHGNIGFAKGCNLGAAKATAEYLLLLKHDCLLPPSALVEMMEALQATEGAMLAGCYIQDADGSDHFNGKGPWPEPKHVFLNAIGLHKYVHTPEENHETPIISSAFMGIRRADYEEAQGLDEAFFLYGETLDLCSRIRAAGSKVIYVPGIKVTHMPTEDKNGLLFREWQQAKGLRRYFDKHFRRKRLPGLLTLVHLAILVRFAIRVNVGALKNRLRKPGVNRKSKCLMILASGLADLPESREMQGKTVLVTGATGQVGLCAVRRLLAAGASVLALSRSDAVPYRHEQLCWIKGDLNDKELPLHDYSINTVVHCVPLWQPLPAVNALTGSGAKRIIVFSSTSIFAKALSKNEYERQVVRNLSQAETAFTERCQADGIALTILRPTLIYGVGLDQNVMALVRFIRRFGFFPVYPPAFGRRQPVHADDLAVAVLQAMANEKTYGKSYNVSGGEIITYYAMLERLFKLLEQKTRIVKTTTLPFALDTIGRLLRQKGINGEIARRMNDDLIFFHDDATRDFGFSPRPFLSGGIGDIEGV